MMDASGGKAGNDVRKLAELISDPRQRKAFAHDPEQALTRAGIDVRALPEAVRSSLYDLSYEELRALSRVKSSLQQAGVSKEDMGEIF